MADSTIEPVRTDDESDPRSAASNAPPRRWATPRWLFGVLAVCLVILIASVAFAFTKAQDRDHAQTTREHAFKALNKQRQATATAQRDLSGERHTISAFEQQAAAPLQSAETGIDLLNQLLADVQAVQVAGTNLGTPEAETGYNDARSRVPPLAGPLNAALNPLPGQINALRAAAPN